MSASCHIKLEAQHLQQTECSVINIDTHVMGWAVGDSEVSLACIVLATWLSPSPQTRCTRRGVDGQRTTNPDACPNEA